MRIERKRFLGILLILLSLVMVLGLVPGISLTANAQTPVDYQTFFVNGVSGGTNIDVVEGTGAVDVTGNTTGRGVTWNAQEKCAEFDGEAYLIIPNPLRNADSNTGFTITMEAYISSANKRSGNYINNLGQSVGKYGWQRLFDLSNGTIQRYLYINAGADSHLRFALATTGAPNTGGDEQGVTPSGANYYDAWHTYSLVAKPGGNMYLYVDGTQISSLTANNTVTTVLNELSYYNKCYIGTSVFEMTNTVASARSDGFFIGKIRGFTTVNRSNVYTLSYNTNGAGNYNSVSTPIIPNNLPTPTKANNVFGGWYTNSQLTQKATSGTELTANTTLYAKWLPEYTVTYKIQNGTWSDNTTANKTEKVVSGSKPASVPTGMKASQGFTGGGAWNTDPTTATITGATTFTYTFKKPQTITASDVTATYGDTDKKVNASATGGGAVSYAVKDGSADYIDVNASTGALTIKKVPASGKAYITVTAAETATYAQATQDVTVTINKKIAEIKWSNTSLTYTGSEQAPTATVANLAQGDSCNVTVSGAKTDVGVYVAKAVSLSNSNYHLAEIVPQTFNIVKADIPLKVSIDDWTYGDTAKNASVTGQPEGMTPKVEYKALDGKESTYSETKPSAAGDYTVRATLAASDNYNAASATENFEIAQKEVTLSWTPSDGEFTYNGADQCPTAAVSNLAGSDSCSVTVSGAATAVGTHTATATKLSNANYKLPENPTFSFTIAKKTIADNAVTLTMAGWTYGDDANEAVVTGDTDGANITYKYKKKSEGDTAYKATKPSQAGTYVVQATIAKTASANEKVLTAEFTIAQRTAQLAWTDLSFRYDGQTHLPTAEVSNLVNGDKCTVTVTGEATDVGTHTATATELSNANYKLPETVTQTFTIAKGEIRPAVTIAGWTYGDNANAPSVEGNIGGGTVTYTYAKKGSTEFSAEVPKAAGTYTVKAAIGANGGYEAAEATADFTIEKKTASLAWTKTSLTYTGSDQIPVATVSNLVGTDSCTVTVDGKQTNAGEYVAKAKILSDSNYKLPETVTQTFIIGKADIPLKVSMDDWTYGDTAKTVSVTGQPTGATPTVEYKVQGAKDSTYSAKAPSNAGKYTVRATLAASDNYNAATAAENFEIGQKTAELSWTPSDGKFTYNGADQCPTAAVSNLKTGDTCSVSVSGAATAVGTHTATATKLSNTNYKLPSDPTFSFKISKADLSSLKVTMANWTYGDKANIPAVEGNTEGGNVSFTYSVKDGNDWSDTKPSDAGQYTVKAEVAATAGYAGHSVTSDFQIMPRTASIAWENITFEYDGNSHIPTAKVTNLVKGDSCDVTVEGAQTKAGTDYVATATALSDSNYVLSTPNPTQKFNITKGELTPAVTIAGWTYGDSPNEPSVEGNIGGGTVTYTYAKKGSTDYSADVPTEAGVYTVKAAIAETDDGYKAAEATTEFVISQKAASLAWTDTSLVYNGEAQAPKAAVANLVGEDSCTVTVEGQQTDAGEYVATATNLSNDNYKLPETVNQTFIIAKAEIKYDSAGYTAVRDAKYHGITVTVTAPENAVVKYGTKKGTYDLDKSPEYKMDGSYTVYYQITADNYKTVEGKETILIMAKSSENTQGPAMLKGNAGSSFSALKARSGKQTKNSITVRWNQVAGAKKYVIYGNCCNSKGHAYYLVRLGVSTGNSFKVSHLSGEKLRKGTMHKFAVIALDEDDQIIERSAVIHVTTKGSKWKNHTGVKVKTPKKGKCTLKVGKSKKIKAEAKGRNVRKHVGLRYESTNPAVATVSKKGVIKGKSTGTCNVLVYTQNGKYRTIKVTVK